MHSFTDQCAVDFMTNLSESEDMKLFELTVIKKLIDFKWPMVKSYIIKRLMIPYIVFMISYMMFSHINFLEGNTIFVPWVRFPVIALLILCCFYTLTIEAYQLIKNGWDYFKEIWNYLDIVPPVMVVGQLAYEFIYFLANYDTTFICPPDPVDPTGNTNFPVCGGLGRDKAII